ncbi:hypothetical protein GCM10012288_01970 [Malaciobacter pacificus]|uniref:Outer membrane porin, OprD family n=1 Tax=Malaciobacter pacificus TaxID=1080223 RepID=A0A5C2H9A4_9BACT|nr:porin [Malaciobacter pacificus]QEP33454.1 outer membrane porin, OprD family [Malaciobacter pacificus]GGD31607.1 hypothetical protein GCM10012288_01970 [Malaciobacter pacificus]
MKKIAKLSLVASLAVAGLTTTASAESLAQAFADSKVKGEIRAQYFAEDYEAAAGKKDSNISVFGGSLGIKTGSFYGLTAGATFYTSHVINKDDESNITIKDEDASGSVLGEAYLAYTMDNSSIKVGRQHLKTPLLGNSSSRLIKDSFEAITFVNTDLPQTTIVLGYVDKMSTRTDRNGNPGEFDQVSKDGAYTILVNNKSIENLDLTAQYASVQDDKDINLMFLEAAYKLGAVKVSGEYLTSENETTNLDGQMLGLKVDAKLADLSLTAAYTTTDDETNLEYGLGEGSYSTYTKLTAGSGKKGYLADTDAYMIKAAYKIADLKLGAAYANYDAKAANKEYDESEINASYKFTKNASVKVSHSMFGKDETKDSETRVNLSYKF